MFDGADGAVWNDEVEVAAYTCTPSGDGWREVDRRLRGIAKQRAALDAEEARWLREAERVQIWRPLGMVNMMDYMERVLGYAPRNAQKRLQVARALEALPALTDALASGAVPFSAVRELVRVVTPTTEEAWLAHIEGMNLRRIEESVAGHRPGDVPTDAPDDDAREHEITLRVNAAAYAMWRQGRMQLEAEHDHRLDDSELVMAIFEAPRVEASGEISGRAKFQIAVRLCPRCERGVQEGAGVGVHVDAATIARARCDAQHLGDLDRDTPERAHQDVPPSVVRFVFRRDQGRCRTPGCRSSRGLEIHHIKHREHGGGHEPRNLCLLCSGCHAAHHRGDLAISGTADALVVTRPRVARHFREVSSPPTSPPASCELGAPSAKLAVPSVLDEGTARGGTTSSRFAQVASRTQARAALVTMGWKASIASAAVDQAQAQLPPDATLEAVIRAALRCCPLSTG
jgi:hypothetical protein